VSQSADSNRMTAPQQLAALEERNQELITYIRAKTNRLLEVMGTVPLNPEELDDTTLLAVDPIGIVTDSFEQVLEHLHRTNAELTATHDELQAIFDSTGGGIVVVDDAMQVVAFNSYSQWALFAGERNVLGRCLRDLICGHEQEECILDQIMATGRRVEQSDFVHDGRHYHLVGTPLKTTEGRIHRMVLLYTDITERRAAAEEIERLAFFDSLTGLPNRVLLKDRLTQLLTRAGRYNDKVAILFIDLDRFKEVNDTLGHSVGDLLLQVVAERLNLCLRSCDTVARLGGDEFVVLLPGISDRDCVGDIADKLLRDLSRPVELDGREVFTSGSIGISLWPDDGDTVGNLFKNADTAMYHAKEQGKNTYRFYTPEMHATSLEQLTLSSDLRYALERGELHLCYQPQVSFKSGGIVGVEALLRWVHPCLGMISPERFVPLAEDNGLIVPIGAWVLQEACRQGSQWIAEGFPSMRMAVNISAKQFRETDFAETVRAVLQQTGLPPHLLELELTEGMLIENVSQTRTTLQALKSMGVMLAIDDFGTGYSSLSYLKHFPLDRLKIDKSFVQEIAESSGDSAAIVEAVVALGHSLKLSVIAEGVEQQDQVDFLHHRKCDELQGYFFSRPLTAEALHDLLRKGMDSPEFCLYHYR